MKSQTIRFDDGEVRARLTIVKASYELDIERQALIDAAIAQEPDLKSVVELAQLYKRNARVFVLPSLLTATAQADIQRLADNQDDGLDRWLDVQWPLTFETLCGLPADLVDEWAGAVYEANPRWDPARVVDQAEREKKAPNSTGG